MFYVVIYYDWDCNYAIKGVFTNKDKAHQCKEYELKLIDIENKKYGEYGRGINIYEVENSDNKDFDAKIADLVEKERKRQQKIYNEIKEKDLAEFNRIKEKYNL